MLRFSTPGLQRLTEVQYTRLFGEVDLGIANELRVYIGNPHIDLSNTRDL